MNNNNSNNIRPDYYNPESPYEPMKVIDAWGLNFRLGNAVKYIGRAGKKKTASLIEDLKKARTCIDLEISKLEEAASIEQSPAEDIPVSEPEAYLKTSKEINSLIGTKWKSVTGTSAEIYGWTYDYSRKDKRTKLLVRYNDTWESLSEIEDFLKLHKRVGEQ